jgi:nucleoside-diphosphate-sugar epimerase
MVHYNSRNSWGNIDLLPDTMQKEIEVVSGDVRDPFFVRQAARGCDAVFHLAALISIPYSYITPKDFIDTNVIGTLNVMQACLDEGVKKVVHTSTSETYGTAKYVPIDEKHPLQGQSPYSASKIGADKLAESYHLSFDLPVATVRPFNTYGIRQSARSVIPTIISQAAAGQKIKLGSLHPTRDYTYVTDTAEAFIRIFLDIDDISSAFYLLALKGRRNQAYNICSGRSVSIKEALHTMLKGSQDIKVNSMESKTRQNDVPDVYGSNNKIKKDTGWRPEHTLEESIERTLKYAFN